MEPRPGAARQARDQPARRAQPMSAPVRSWVFRNRARLEALLGRPPAAPPVRSEAGPRRKRSARPRVVELQPVRRRRGQRG
jgi:hypothetical protein